MNLAAIRAKAKELIGESDYDNTILDVIINRVYQRQLPLEFSLEALKSEFSQVTAIGVGEYAVDPDLYLIIKEPVYLDGSPVNFWVEKTFFYGLYPQTQTWANSTPADVLYWGNKLILRPPPDTNGAEAGGNYKLKADTIVVPTALTAVDQEPLEKLWGMVIACDAAIEIMVGSGRNEDAEALYKYRTFHAERITFKEALKYQNARAIAQF